LFDAGIAALKASGKPNSKADVAAAISKLQVSTTIGALDWTKGPVPNCVTGPIIGIQWMNAPAGSKFKVDAVVVDNADDPNVPLGSKLIPYNG
jgi:branched-chain amino acid transport system substrate-binding protein